MVQDSNDSIGTSGIPAGTPGTAAVARRVATLAAYGGGLVTAASALTAAVLAGQAAIARLIIPGAEAPPPRCDGDYGDQHTRVAPLRLALLGDSTAAGYGVEQRGETPGALLGAWLAEMARRPVRVRCMAVVGSTSDMLAPQVEEAVETGVDLAIIMIGANDVTGRVRAQIAAAYLHQAVDQLRAAGAEVVVGTCPDLGTVRPIQPPLRWLARRWSRQLAVAQTVAVVEAGGRAVSLGDLLGPEFAAAPETMFGADRFHPSADGYAAAARAVLPTALAALGIAAEGRPSPARGESVRSLPAAAVVAAGRAGTEVSQAQVAGDDQGPGGRWAQLRMRVRQWIPGAGTDKAADQTTHTGPSAVPSQAEHSVMRSPIASPSTVE